MQIVNISAYKFVTLEYRDPAPRMRERCEAAA
jgi:hypothetical protein